MLRLVLIGFERFQTVSIGHCTTCIVNWTAFCPKYVSDKFAAINHPAPRQDESAMRKNIENYADYVLIIYMQI